MDTALEGLRVLLGVSGGVAAYKAASLARGLKKAGAEVQVIMTGGATRFVQPDQFAALTGRPAHTDTFTDVHRIVHVEVARWADVAIIAPATTNVIAKFAAGIADDLVTSAFTCLTVPTVVAPATTAPWIALRPTPPHPITATLSPAAMSAEFTAAPNPVSTPQPISAACGKPTSSGMRCAAVAGTTQCSANTPSPSMCATGSAPRRKRVVPSGMLAPLIPLAATSHSAGWPRRQ